MKIDQENITNEQLDILDSISLYSRMLTKTKGKVKKPKVTKDIKQVRKENGLKPIKYKLRPCLGCRVDFYSEGGGNAICQACKDNYGS